MNTLPTVQPPTSRPAKALPLPGLHTPVLIEDRTEQRFLRRLSITLAFGIIAFLVWAGFATVKEVSVAHGQIVPAGFERVVQHLEGGVIEDIKVTEGEEVDAGAVLFVLGDAGSVEDLATGKRRQADLDARIEAVLALTEDRAPDLGAFGREVATLAGTVYEARREQLNTQRELLESQIEQARRQIASYDAQSARLQGDLQFATENFERIKPLVASGYATAALLAERRKAVSDANHAIAIAREQEEEAKARLDETRKRLESLHADTKSTWAEELRDLREQRAALEGDVSKAARRSGRLTVRSPVRGIIQSLEVTTIGGVIGPGQALATVVPVDEALSAHTRVPVNQIGYVKIGMPAHVKVSAFEFTRFGWIDGTVTHISPSAFAHDGEAPYFRVTITLADSHLPEAPSAYLVPGMGVDADIITGEKSILAYFLSPVHKALRTSFRER
ncbi:HlyD family type I secretion periplasmic adaptor subunit [Acuticoccus sp. MNP-M23]|uniref:HlyD family type I secretion periplasmic adaptor subunit n=1 Tax=Acuticoccus sp. MNP-M23 TaxID=3072793 RepID=UPI00281575BC|nr:HlyD family type I secretion periplasmic adaptor subunit [Acuticoccus sp. MNP-M23]WMS40965.1 HlyD family type I secretion periplasmic adaptor subunit [Acuticoccus sp. MNP-M23]